MRNKYKNEGNEKTVELIEIQNYESIPFEEHENEIKIKDKKDSLPSLSISLYLFKEMCCNNKKNFIYTVFCSFLALSKTFAQVSWPLALNWSVSINEALEGAFPECEILTLTDCNFLSPSYLLIGGATLLLGYTLLADFLIPIFTTNLSKNIASRYVEQSSQGLIKGKVIDNQEKGIAALDTYTIQDALNTRINGFFVTFSWYLEIVLRLSILLLYFTNRWDFWLIGVFFCTFLALAKYILFPRFVQIPEKSAGKEHAKELEELKKTYAVLDFHTEETRKNILVNFQKNLNKAIKKKSRANRNSNIITILEGTVINVIMMLILFYTTYLIQKGEPNNSFMAEKLGQEENYSASDLSLILSNFLMIMIALLVISQTQRQAMAAQTSLVKAIKVLKFTKDIFGLEITHSFPEDARKGFTFSFKNVSLELKNNKFGGVAIKNVQFSLHSHSITGLTSAPGIKKTTILKLLYKCKSHLNYEGNIEISNNSGEVFELRHIDRDELRKNIVFFKKKSKIIRDKNIRDNLRLFDADAKDSKMLEILETVGIFSSDEKPILDSFTEGFNSNKKQRLGIAQALVKILKTKAKIIFYQQDISMFTKATQSKILNFINNLKDQGAAIFFVPTEVKSLKMADKIILLKKSENNEVVFIETRSVPSCLAYDSLKKCSSDFYKMTQSSEIETDENFLRSECIDSVYQGGNSIFNNSQILGAGKAAIILSSKNDCSRWRIL